MRYLILLSIFVLSCFSLSHAQDIRFSQYYSAPQLYNPAFTGYFNGDVRVNANYKSQWVAPFNAYRTIGGGADFSILKEKFRGSGFGVGVQFYSDQAGDLNLNTNQLLLSLGYTQRLGLNFANNLSAGFQMNTTNRSINMSNAIFENQINNSGFDDVVGNDNYWRVSVGVGMLWYAEPSENVNFYIGGSALNLLKPNQSFFTGNTDELYVRYVGQMGLNFNVNQNIDISASTMYQNQGPFQEFLVGFLGRYDFSPNKKADEKFKLGVGLWYRMQDAIIPVGRAEYGNFALTYNFDANISSLKRASRGNGGHELSLIYTGFWNSDRRKASGNGNRIGCPVL
ncbi:MAG: PorP/SprF family type IX secretion system membrane protein [Chitinophagales bacterium]|nr:PorP/SprF family type IX secretion system membrane protein [Chitinophagales bacterium]